MKKHKGLVTFLIISILILLGLIVAFFAVTGYYKTHFFNGTTLSGVDVSGLTAKQATEKVTENISDYLISIRTRDGEKYNLLGPKFGYTYESNGEIEKILELQNASTWMVESKGNVRHDYSVRSGATYDEEMLKEEIIETGIFSPSNMVEPKNAYIEWDVEQANYIIVPEESGNILNFEKTFNIIKSAVDAGEKTITIPDSCYTVPDIRTNDPMLNDTIERLQSYFGHSITYDFGGEIEEKVISRNDIAGWLRVDESYNITIDEARIEKFVQKLADEYNTYGDRRKFRTTKGDNITIGGGDFGWVIDKAAEKKRLLSDIASDDNVVREPMFSQRGVSFGAYDIGDTYIEIDYTNQHMWYYKNGEIVCDTDVVTGNLSKNNGSPDGVFKIAYKEKDATLAGEDYESKDIYFMPFAYNVGIHDASWRSEFGGELYKYSGSHGCINAPASIVEAMFDMVDVGTPVVAYYRNKVTLTAENCRISNAYSYKEKTSKKK